MKLLFDCETNGLYFDVTELHCICTADLDTGERRSFYGDTLEEGLAYLSEAEVLAGHNIIGYDLVVLNKLKGFKSKAKVFDTLVASRLLYPEMKKFHYPLIESMYSEGKLSAEAYKKLRGRMLALSHSLEAWGYRLGELKGDYKATNDFSTFTPEMLAYCEQDVNVSFKLVSMLKSQAEKLKGPALDIEHKVADIVTRQWVHGWGFDEEQALKVLAKLQVQRDAIEDKLVEKYGYEEEIQKTPQWYVIEADGHTFKEARKSDVTEVAYKVLNKPVKKYTKDAVKALVQEGPPKVIQYPFNPYSGQQVAKILKETYGWVPAEFTETGEPKVDEDVLETLVSTMPDVADILECHKINKIISFLITEPQKYEERKVHKKGSKKAFTGWLDVSRNGRIHGEVITNGATTGRATHRKPNLAQVPAEKQGKKSYGKICRQLFIPRKGFVAIGTDASSLELRCLGHYMAPYDGGAFSKAVVEGKKEEGTDVHTLNMHAFGINSRDVAKTLIYGMLYGAGEEKAGRIVGVNSEEVLDMKARCKFDDEFRRQWKGVEKSRSRRNEEFFEKKAKEKTQSNPNHGKEIVKKLKDVGYVPFPVDDYHVALCLKGRELIQNFLDNTPALAALREAVKKAHQDRGGLLWGLDGRPLYIRSEHAALNTLLQSAGAIICKQWMIEIEKLVEENGLQGKFFQMGWIHDEIAGEIQEGFEDTFSTIPYNAMRNAEKFFNFKCELDVEVKFGRSWADTH